MSVTKLKRGGYRIDVQVNGERIRERFMGTLTEAKRREAELRKELQYGFNPDAKPATKYRPKVTMRDLFDLTVRENWSQCKCDSGIRRAKMILSEFIGWDTDPDTIDAETISKMAQFYRERGNSEATINRKKHALSAMLKYGRIHNKTTSHPHLNVRKENNRRERWVTEGEEKRLLSSAQKLYGNEYKFLIMFLIDTGFRLGEALNAQVSWVHGESIHLPSRFSKNGNPRVIPLTDRLLAMLPKEGAVFPSYYNRNTRHLYSKLERVKADAEITNPSEIVYHTFRHTCATRLVKRGANLVTVKGYLGHETAAMTHRYAHLDEHSMREARDLLQQDYNH